MITAYDFEKPLLELEHRIQEREKEEPRDEPALQELRLELERKQREIYSQLTPWQRVLLARDKERPRSLDFVKALMTDFVEIHGDRAFGDDKAMVCGFATFRGRPL